MVDVAVYAVGGPQREGRAASRAKAQTCWDGRASRWTPRKSAEWRVESMTLGCRGKSDLEIAMSATNVCADGI